MFAKIYLAASIICGIRNPEDILVCGKDELAHRAVHKLAKLIGAKAISGRYCPGTLTNKNSNLFMEPKLIIVANPAKDH